MPPPGQIFADAPTGPAVPPPPVSASVRCAREDRLSCPQTILQVPTFDDILALLRVCAHGHAHLWWVLIFLQENRHAQVATIDQQREMMRYLRGLNEWLERDVRDRQDEMRSVAERINELQNMVGQLMQGGPEGASLSFEW